MRRRRGVRVFPARPRLDHETRQRIQRLFDGHGLSGGNILRDQDAVVSAPFFLRGPLLEFRRVLLENRSEDLTALPDRRFGFIQDHGTIETQAIDRQSLPGPIQDPSPRPLQINDADAVSFG